MNERLQHAIPEIEKLEDDRRDITDLIIVVLFLSLLINFLASQLYDLLTLTSWLTSRTAYFLLLTVVSIIMAILVFLRCRVVSRYRFVYRGRTGLSLTKREDCSLCVERVKQPEKYAERFAYLPYGAMVVLRKYYSLLSDQELSSLKESDDQRLTAELIQYLLIRRYEWRTREDRVWWQREWLKFRDSGSSPGANYRNRYLPFTKIKGLEENRFLKFHDVLHIGTEEDIGNEYDRYGPTLILPPGMSVVVDNSVGIMFRFEGHGWNIKITLSGASGGPGMSKESQIAFDWEIRGGASSWRAALALLPGGLVLAFLDEIRAAIGAILATLSRTIKTIFKYDWHGGQLLQMELAWKLAVPFEEYHRWAGILVEDFRGYLNYDLGREITVAQMSKDELKELIETLIEQKLLEMLGDTDEGLEIKRSLRTRLLRQRKAVAAGERGQPFEDAVRQLD